MHAILVTLSHAIAGLPCPRLHPMSNRPEKAHQQYHDEVKKLLPVLPETAYIGATKACRAMARALELNVVSEHDLLGGAKLKEKIREQGRSGVFLPETVYHAKAGKYPRVFEALWQLFTVDRIPKVIIAEPDVLVGLGHPDYAKHDSVFELSFCPSPSEANRALICSVEPVYQGGVKLSMAASRILRHRANERAGVELQRRAG